MKKNKFHRTEKEIISTLFEEMRPLTINEITELTDISWLTVKRYLEINQKRNIIIIQKGFTKEKFKINPEYIKAVWQYE